MNFGVHVINEFVGLLQSAVTVHTCTGRYWGSSETENLILWKFQAAQFVHVYDCSGMSILFGTVLHQIHVYYVSILEGYRFRKCCQKILKQHSLFLIQWQAATRKMRILFSLHTIYQNFQKLISMWTFSLEIWKRLPRELLNLNGNISKDSNTRGSWNFC